MNDDFAEDSFQDEGRSQPTRRQTQRVVQRETKSYGAGAKRRRAKRRQDANGIHRRRDKHWNW